MGIIYVPNRKIIGNVKPDIPLEVDWRNPINSGLLASITADGQYLYDRVSGLVSSTATIGTPAAGVGTHGRYTDLTAGSGSGISIPLPAWANNHDTTHHFGIDLKSVSGWAPIFEIFSGSTSSLYLGVNANATADLYGSPLSGTNIDIPGCATAILGAYHDCVFTYSSDTQLIAFYIDGKLFYSTGIGVALYPTVISAPQIGFMSSASFSQKGNLHYYNLFDRVLSLPEIQEISANPYQVVKSTRKSLWFNISGGSGVALVGDSPQEQRATGTVSLSVPVAGISIQKAVGKGIANIGIPLAGDATVRQNTAGDLLISVPLDGNAIQRQLDSGTLSMATSISGQSKQSQSVLGALSISVTMAGDVIQRAYADGTLTNTAAGAISLTGYSLQTQIAHGLASIGVALSGHSLSVQSGDGKPTTLVPLSGVVAQAQLVSGGLGVKVDLLGHMLQKAISNASLSVSGGGGVSLSGHSTQHQAAESTMTLQVVLSGKSVQESIAQGYLSGAGALLIDPRYLITGLGRNFDITTRKEF